MKTIILTDDLVIIIQIIQTNADFNRDRTFQSSTDDVSAPNPIHVVSCTEMTQHGVPRKIKVKRKSPRNVTRT